ITAGLPASPGAASGIAVFDPDAAERRASDGTSVILVRDETTPEDFHGIVAAKAVLTARGGMTSHAAVVARGMGKCAVVGAKEMHVDIDHRHFTVGDTTVNEGAWLTPDGATGRVFDGDLPTTSIQTSQAVRDMQRMDFEGIFEAMNGYPVCIRLLDPPLHEFLPHGGEESKLLARTLGISRTELQRTVESLRETNPMLGHRGCRLGITFPEITE